MVDAVIGSVAMAQPLLPAASSKHVEQTVGGEGEREVDTLKKMRKPHAALVCHPAEEASEAADLT